MIGKQRCAPWQGFHVFVKFCGMQDVDSIRVAIESGADAIGFILADSRRRILPDKVAKIREHLKPGHPPLIGVTVNAEPGVVMRDVETAGLDLIQLSGDETPDVLDRYHVPVIKALRFEGGVTLDEALLRVASWLEGPRAAQYVIVDGHATGAFGGTGARADWNLVAGIARRFPIILAGGLSPDNVADAIRMVQPFGVDVSSGTETDGAKDHAKIRAFAHNARSSLDSWLR
jgi:phosphoribosylanthranilate isomerase